jgi:hypothetical protein
VKACGKQSAGFLLVLFFDPEDGGDMFLRNVGGLSTDYTALSQKIEFFITTAVKTSNPTSNELFFSSTRLNDCTLLD